MTPDVVGNTSISFSTPDFFIFDIITVSNNGNSEIIENSDQL